MSRFVGARSLSARLLALAVALLALEGVTRLFIVTQGTVFEPGIGYVRAPGVALWGREGWALSTWQAHGVRRGQGGDGATLLVVGDSFTEALQVSDDEVFTSVAERRLALEGVRRRVLNAGYSGGSLPEYVVRSRRWAELFSQELVVVQTSVHDFEADAWNPGKPHWVLEPGGEVHAEAAPVGRYQGLRAIAWRLRDASMLVAILPARVEEYRTAISAEPPLFHATAQVDEPSTVHEERPIAPQIRAVARAFGDRLCLLVLPEIDPSDPGRPSVMEEEIAVACEAEGVHCVIPRAELAAWLRRTGRSPYGFGQRRFGLGHLNPAGHRIVGEALARGLLARGQLPRPESE